MAMRRTTTKISPIPYSNALSRIDLIIIELARRFDRCRSASVSRNCKETAFITPPHLTPSLSTSPYPSPGPLDRLPLFAQVPQRLIGDALRLNHHPIALVQLLSGPLEALRVVQQPLLRLVPEANLVKVVAVRLLKLVRPLPLKVLLQPLQLRLVAVVSVPQTGNGSGGRIPNLQAKLFQLEGDFLLIPRCHICQDQLTSSLASSMFVLIAWTLDRVSPGIKRSQFVEIHQLMSTVPPNSYPIPVI